MKSIKVLSTNYFVLDYNKWIWIFLTFRLHSQSHVVGRVVLLPEGTQPLIDIDLLLLWLLLQGLCISWCCHNSTDY